MKDKEKQNEAWDRGIEYGKKIASKETAEKIWNRAYQVALNTRRWISRRNIKGVYRWKDF